MVTDISPVGQILASLLPRHECRSKRSCFVHVLVLFMYILYYTVSSHDLFLSYSFVFYHQMQAVVLTHVDSYSDIFL